MLPGMITVNYWLSNYVNCLLAILVVITITVYGIELAVCTVIKVHIIIYFYFVIWL